MRKIAEHWVIELLLRHKRARTNIQLAVESGRTLRAISSACCRLVDSGAIVRVKPGKYVLAAGCETPEQCEPLFEAEQASSAPIADSHAVVSALSVTDLQPFDDEMRVQDIRLAETAKMSQPRNIRTVIDNNYKDLQRYGALHSRNAHSANGSTVHEYWLNRGQAIRVLTLLKTDFANEATCHVIDVFLAYQDGKLHPLQPSDNTAVLAYLERLDRAAEQRQERSDRAADQRQREMIQFMAENNKTMAGMMMEIRHSTVGPISALDNVRQLDQKLFEGTIFGIRKAPRHLVKRQGAAARRLADLMDKPTRQFSRDKLTKTLQWLKAIEGIDNRYYEGDLISVPAVKPNYTDWFAMTIDEINDRRAWTWALTDEGMRQLERRAPDIKAWLEEAA